MIRLDVASHDRAGTDHCFVANRRAGQNRGVVGDANTVADSRGRCKNLVDVLDVVTVRVDIEVV